MDFFNRNHYNLVLFGSQFKKLKRPKRAQIHPQSCTEDRAAGCAEAGGRSLEVLFKYQSLTRLVLVSFFNVFGMKNRRELMKLADKTKLESITCIEHDEDTAQQKMG